MTIVIASLFTLIYLRSSNVKVNLMRTQAFLKNITAEQSKHIVMRNLARIMDTRVVDLDIRTGLLTILCSGQGALRKVERELQRLGYPVKKIISYERPVSAPSPGLYRFTSPWPSEKS